MNLAGNLRKPTYIFDAENVYTKSLTKLIDSCKILMYVLGAEISEMFGDLYDLTVRMSIYVGRISSAVTTQCRSEWFAKRARSALEQTMSGGVLSCVYVRYHIITSRSCRPTRC